ncbi:DUF2179 domain-containing protein [Acetobacterium woodii]|uniref:UPF0316 protein Awo_c32160 n=1 Tax=Acetobacterium woodii (strain ATCC 29683 / DSM 1030 / JCM 2381 / KCTC 1655 / WB1) TaxID=931626 RepID=H6LJL6_ACEWD|nr:DUF2179 domain-containing protein [Acetobacterium woodii]AFA49944.1 hypothetical protein Awo_c32160 [Acetobacterium woodii DSM 1030]
MTKLLLIVIVQLLYVPMLTLRTICMVKNLKILTALFGFLEALISIFALSIVLSGEQSIAEMIVYAIGFAVGLIVGISIEKKLAIGFSSIQVNIEKYNDKLIELLRDDGFGVTVYYGEGKDGKRINLDILTKRKKEKYLLQLINQYEPNAFVMSFEPKMFRGGYLTEMMSRRARNRQENKKLEINPSKNVIVKTFEELKCEAEALKKNWNRDQ